MTTDALTRALAILNEPRGDDDGLFTPRPIVPPPAMMGGTTVSPDELALRRAIEGGNSIIMCAGCGYGLVPDDTICPKCGSSSYEVATALVERKHLPDLLAGHKEAEPQLSGQRAGHKSGMASVEKRCKKRAETT